MTPIQLRAAPLFSMFLTLALGALGSAPLPAAETSLSADIALVSDYRFRGVSQTDRHPAVQGGWTLSGDSGFSIGVWASNVDFAADDGSASTSMELDFVLGYSGAFGDSDGAGWSVSYAQYSYPGYDELNYPEVIIDLAFGDLAVQLVHSDDYFATGEPALVGILGYTFALGERLSLGMSYGSVNTEARLFGETDDLTSAEFTDSHSFYSIELGAQWREDGARLSLGWHGTNVDDMHCTGNICEGAWVAGISQSF
ncbi:MAG: hypothetical protein ISN29_10125 [Gammaproteobacteria bacterium AqS3]|nr:hypothetical protein [Gammaproteobacteria bacterium AqS3]